MTTSEKLTIRILLLVAGWIAPFSWRKEISTLDALISTGVKTEGAD